MDIDELIDALTYAREMHISRISKIEVRNIHIKNHPIGVVTGVKLSNENEHKLILEYEPI